MNERIKEFQCIMPVANIPSVLGHGILSYELMSKLPHHSVAMPEIQDRRDQKHVPGGLRLHQYANLYFHARNPMLFKRQTQFSELCVLQISVEVSKLEGVVFADCNASSDYVRFLHPSQSNLLNLDDIYAMDWRHPNDSTAYFRHKSRKCAEVLIPQRVEPKFIAGAYVLNAKVAESLKVLGFTPPITISPVLFFN